MHLLVCGGAGFMGSHFVHHMLRAYPEYRVVVFDALTYAGNTNNLRDLEGDPRYAFVQGDITNRRAVAAAVEDHSIDVIVNYAAETHVDRSIKDPRSFLETDVLGVYTLLEVAREAALRLIQISTDEVYGDIANGVFHETSPFRPSSPYAASKAAGDLLCHAYVRTYQTPVIVTHSCNVYGPNQYPEKLIPLSITNLIDNTKVPIYGDGQQVREWIFVEDHCRAIDAVVHKGRTGESYNIGTGREVKNIETARLLLRALDKSESSIEYVADRPGHDVRYALDHAKIKEELGWEPAVAFEDGLARTVAWYKQNEWWWRPLKQS